MLTFEFLLHSMFLKLILSNSSHLLLSFIFKVFRESLINEMFCIISMPIDFNVISSEFKVCGIFCFFGWYDVFKHLLFVWKAPTTMMGNSMILLLMLGELILVKVEEGNGQEWFGMVTIEPLYYLTKWSQSYRNRIEHQHVKKGMKELVTTAIMTFKLHLFFWSLCPVNWW